MNEKEARAMFNHREAHCIMTYRCKCCGFEERIWNSRDGVTPFCIACPSCGKLEHYHEDWHNDRYAPLHQAFMKPGERMFINMTKERAREYAVRNVDLAIELSQLKPNERNHVIARAIESYYGDGKNPDIDVVK